MKKNSTYRLFLALCLLGSMLWVSCAGASKQRLSFDKIIQKLQDDNISEQQRAQIVQSLLKRQQNQNVPQQPDMTKQQIEAAWSNLQNIAKLEKELKPYSKQENNKAIVDFLKQAKHLKTTIQKDEPYIEQQLTNALYKKIHAKVAEAIVTHYKDKSTYLYRLRWYTTLGYYYEKLLLRCIAIEGLIQCVQNNKEPTHDLHVVLAELLFHKKGGTSHLDHTLLASQGKEEKRYLGLYLGSLFSYIYAPENTYVTYQTMQGGSWQSSTKNKIMNVLATQKGMQGLLQAFRYSFLQQVRKWLQQLKTNPPKDYCESWTVTALCLSKAFQDKYSRLSKWGETPLVAYMLYYPRILVFLSTLCVLLYSLLWQQQLFEHFPIDCTWDSIKTYLWHHMLHGKVMKSWLTFLMLIFATNVMLQPYQWRYEWLSSMLADKYLKGISAYTKNIYGLEKPLYFPTKSLESKINAVFIIALLGCLFTKIRFLARDFFAFIDEKQS